MFRLAPVALLLASSLTAPPVLAQGENLQGGFKTPALDLSLDYGALEQDEAADSRSQTITGDPAYKKEGYANLTSKAGEFEFAPIILDRRQDGSASETGLTTPFGIEWKKRF